MLTLDLKLWAKLVWCPLETICTPFKYSHSDNFSDDYWTGNTHLEEELEGAKGMDFLAFQTVP